MQANSNLTIEDSKLPPNIQSAQNLITSREATRNGFLQQALTKTRKATSYVLEAHELADALANSENPSELVHIRTAHIRNALIAAAGFSDKARGKLSEAELESALLQILEDIRSRSTEGWRQEIIYRFLLTRGDTLGGSMRNITGALGGMQLSKAIVETLLQSGIEPKVISAPKNQEKVVSITWNNRLLVFDKKPSFVGNNIDLILLDTNYFVANTVTLEAPRSYLACGELKGGIDPAGADEHWKTAQSAFDRIRERFQAIGLVAPALFFVGAAIESTMATQIFDQLRSGKLSYAANLTVVQQLTDLVEWLIQL